MPEPVPFSTKKKSPPDHAERRRALNPTRSFLVQAPAGSGKTYLLTQRFLRLLGQAETPDEIVAITFTNAAAAEMRNRVLSELERAEAALVSQVEPSDPESLASLARTALAHSKLMAWRILDQPEQLRITTIDAFCRGLALQSPLSWGLLSGLGGRLETVTNADEHYRKAARRVIESLEGDASADRALQTSVAALLEWRDNNWKEIEELIEKMLKQRNRWFKDFVFNREPDWEELRHRLEGPFRRASRQRLARLGELLDRLPGSLEFALEMARTACESPGKFSPLSLAERAEFPGLMVVVEEALILEEASDACSCLASFLMTGGKWRSEKGLTTHYGFPATTEGRAAKRRFGEFVSALDQEPGLREALAAFMKPIPVRYTDEEWELIRHCFEVLRHAAGQLQVVFAETGSVDFTEVAQIALRMLAPENGLPSDVAQRHAAGIKHLLVDEFQDTSRNQHQLLSRLIAAWPEREGRSCFCVGDPMQSIYGFRDAEVELFERTRRHGLAAEAGTVDAAPFEFDFVPLTANFRTVPSLVEDLNGHFERIFAAGDGSNGSGVEFSTVEPARDAFSAAKAELHLEFTAILRSGAVVAPAGSASEETAERQTAEIVALIRSKLAAETARIAASGEVRKCRIAVLAMKKPSLVRIAEALRKAGIGYRAIDLVPLAQRPEVLDALALARALLNPVDRTAWLGVLRAPWCGLSLEELHRLTSADDAEITATPVPALLRERLESLRRGAHMDSRAFAAASRVAQVMAAATEARATEGATASLGTRLESVWKALGGEVTVTREQRENLRLLWAALDRMPQGEVDLLGAGLDAALENLFALPDPEESSEFGVQLMTIHKSKGLEFELVLVADLEAAGKTGDTELMSWLERGLTGDENSDVEEPTELLIAPIQAKGADSGAARKWVGAVKQQREKEERRRLLYVAATRARDELHLFARPRFALNAKAGAWELAKPLGLLQTAWPAFASEIEARFAAWLADDEQGSAAGPGHEAGLALAAEGEPVARRATMLKRLPADYVAPLLESARRASSNNGSWPANPEEEIDGELEGRPYARSDGGLEARLLGTAVHALLEQWSRALARGDGANLDLSGFLPQIAAAMRGQGMPRNRAVALAREAGEAARGVALEPVGAWILAPHAEAETESRWIGFVQQANGRETRWNLRPDRVFFAGTPPPLGSSAEPVWWVIDYKNSDAGSEDLSDPDAMRRFLERNRELYSAQLAAYAQVLRGLKAEEPEQSPLPVRAGIYYTRLRIFDWWEC